MRLCCLRRFRHDSVFVHMKPFQQGSLSKLIPQSVAAEGQEGDRHVPGVTAESDEPLEQHPSASQLLR